MAKARTDVWASALISVGRRRPPVTPTTLRSSADEHWDGRVPGILQRGRQSARSPTGEVNLTIITGICFGRFRPIVRFPFLRISRVRDHRPSPFGILVQPLLFRSPVLKPIPTMQSSRQLAFLLPNLNDAHVKARFCRERFAQMPRRFRRVDVHLLEHVELLLRDGRARSFTVIVKF